MSYTRQRWMSLSCSEFVLSPNLLQPRLSSRLHGEIFHSFIGSSSSPVNGSGSFLCNMIYSHQKEKHWKVVEKREKNEREEKHIFQPAAETKWKLHVVDGALSVLRVLKGERRCDFSFAKKYIEKNAHQSCVVSEIGNCHRDWKKMISWILVFLFIIHKGTGLVVFFVVLSAEQVSALSEKSFLIALWNYKNMYLK